MIDTPGILSGEKQRISRGNRLPKYINMHVHRGKFLTEPGAIIYTFGVGTIFKCFQKNSLIVTKATFN